MTEDNPHPVDQFVMKHQAELLDVAGEMELSEGRVVGLQIRNLDEVPGDDVLVMNIAQNRPVP